jgi:simple sugar transport system permease protein
VLGGASIFGGSGSVTGTALGVILISLVQNSLILLGVPSAWQRLAVGVLLLIGISAQALSAATGKRRRAVAAEAPA